jgi:uncharacterized delta-60 repeat protein
LKRLNVFCGAALGLLASSAHAGFGDRDCSFGVNGRQAFAGNAGALFNVAAEATGDTLIRIGHTNNPNQSAPLFRTNAAGTTSVKITEAGTYWTDPALVVLPDGKFLMTRTIGSGGPNFSVERHLASGALDTTFGVNGRAEVVANGSLVIAYAGPIVQNDGKIIVAGNTFSQGTPAIVRFNADGTPDATFGTSGFAPGVSGQIRSMALQADGKILTASNQSVSRFSTGGQLDTTFGSGGSVSLSQVFTTIAQIRLQPSGKLLVAGVTEGSQIRLARLDASGALDVTVGGGTGYMNAMSSSEPLRGTLVSQPSLPPSTWMPLSVSPDGRPIVIGRPSADSSAAVGAIVRYTVDLAADTVVPLAFAPSMLHILPDGRMLVGNATSLGLHRLLGDLDSPTCVPTSAVLTTSPNPSNFNQSVTLSATVTPGSGVVTPTGSVQFKDGAANLGSPVTLVNGVASAVVTSLLEGTHSITATYEGEAGFGDSISSPVTHNVNFRPATSTTMTSSPNPSSAGQTVTLTATVTPASGSGTPTGSVQFKDGGINFRAPVTLSGGVATLATSSLPDGSHTLTASYLGDSNFGLSTSPPHSHLQPIRISISDPTGNSALASPTMMFNVILTATPTAPVTVDYATADRSAKAGVDYLPRSGTLTIPAGQTSAQVVSVDLIPKTVPGPGKDFFLTLSNPANAGIAKGAGIGTITYVAAGTPSVYVDDPVVVEGYSGTTLLGFTVSLSQASSSSLNPVTVDYATADGTAVAGTDYTARAGKLIFSPNQTHRWVMVSIAANATTGSNRSFVLNLSNSTVAVAKGQGTGTIVDDDPAPAAATIVQYRLYSQVTKEHLYTTDANEYAVLGTRSWDQEGTAYTMFRDGGSYGGQYAIPLYRMYHGGILQHHWTTDPNEVMVLADGGTWNYEGITGYVLPSSGVGTTPLYRLRLNAPPLHLWTTDSNENTVLSTQRGWVFEGIVGHVIP